MRYPRSRTREEGAERLFAWARIVLTPVAAIGAVLSFRSLYEAAVPTFGPYYAAGIPLLVDLLILGASLTYVAGAQLGRPMRGWRLTAHAGVFATLLLNALAAATPAEVPWHVTAPAIWAVLVELTAQQVLSESRVVAHPARGIPATVWLTAPVESARTRLLMLRTGTRDAQAARVELGTLAAAREALRQALPDRQGRPVRSIIRRQLRAGSLSPADVLAPLGWGDANEQLEDRRPEVVLRTVLQDVLRGGDGGTTGQARRPSGPSGPSSGEATHSDDRPIHSASRRRTLQASPATKRAVGEGTPAPAGDDAKDARPSGQPRRRDQLRRLDDAVEIITDRPSITGPEMTVELATRGWEVSGRTASRILRRAHKETLGDRSPVTLSSESDEVALPHERGVQPGLV